MISVVIVQLTTDIVVAGSIFQYGELEIGLLGSETCVCATMVNVFCDSVSLLVCGDPYYSNNADLPLLIIISRFLLQS